jgi:hypothetical protein
MVRTERKRSKSPRKGTNQSSRTSSKSPSRPASPDKNQGPKEASSLEKKDIVIEPNHHRTYSDKVTIKAYEDKPYYKVFFDQLWVMLKKNSILQRRYINSTIAQVIGAPFILMLLLFIQQKADDSRQKLSNLHPLSYSLPGIAQCQVTC